LKDESTPKPETTSSEETESSGSGCGGYVAGCLFPFVIIFFVAIFYSTFGSGFLDFEPGEANLCTEALEQTFVRLGEVVPDSLQITGELDPFLYYSSCKSFANRAYVVNPVLDAVLKADTTQKYNFQYIARVDHVGPGEFEVSRFQVDEIWVK
jgi:hypothetical protein